MKKSLASVLTNTMISALTIPAMEAGSSDALSDSNIDTVAGDYLFETIVDSAEHQKLKVTNTKTDEVEWVESFLNESGGYDYVATSADGVYSIVRKGNAIHVSEDGVVIDEILLPDFTEVLGSISAPGNEIMGYGSWTDLDDQEFSTHLGDVTISVAVVILFALIPNVITISKTMHSIITGIAGTLVGATARWAYVKESSRVRFDYENQLMQREVKLRFYLDEDYKYSAGSTPLIYTVTEPAYMR